MDPARSTVARLLIALLMAAILLVLLGCRDTLDPASDGALTPDENVALAALIGIRSLELGAYLRSGPVGAPTAAGAVHVDFDTRRPCVLGGAVRSSGTVDIVTADGPPPTSVVDVSATEIHEACVFLVAASRIAVTGDPHVTTTVHAADRGGVPWGTQRVAVEGAVTWESDDGRDGRCPVDLEVVVEPDAHRQVVRGTFCDHTFDVTTTGS